MTPRNMRRWGRVGMNAGTAILGPTFIIQLMGWATIPDELTALGAMLFLGGLLAVMKARKNERDAEVEG